MTSRRQFIQVIPAAGASLMAGRVRAQAVMVKEDDAQAKALGYISEAGKTDKTKYKMYAAGQSCSNCGLYQGKVSDASAGCALFAGKQVAGRGWCSAYAKKA